MSLALMIPLLLMAGASEIATTYAPITSLDEYLGPVGSDECIGGDSEMVTIYTPIVSLDEYIGPVGPAVGEEDKTLYEGHGIGGPDKLRNGQLCALAPELLEALAVLVDRCEKAPILEGNEGLRGPFLAEAKAVLKKAGIESSLPRPGTTYQGWLAFKGAPMCLICEEKDRPLLEEALQVLLAENRKPGR